MSKRRTDPASEWTDLQRLLQPDATYERSRYKFWRMDDVARDKWSMQVSAPAWQLLCLWNNLDPDPLGSSAEDLHDKLNDELSAADRVAHLERFLDGLKLQTFAQRKDPSEHLRQLSADLDRVASSIASGALRHQCSASCEHDANACVGISDFVAWAEQSRLSRWCDWPPRSFRRPERGAAYVRMPPMNRVLTLTVAVAQHFDREYTLASGKVPTYEEIANYLRTKHVELSDRLVRQVAANLRPDDMRPGPRRRQ